MKFLSSYSRLKERVRMLEKYVDQLGKTNQAQQILLEKLEDKLEDGLQHKPHDKLHDKVDQLSAEVLARSLETKLLRERAQIFEDMSLARSLRPAGADAAIARLKSPCVSVVLPTHNRASTLPDAIASVQAQAMGDWELIIVDDGSTDHTREVVSPFLEDKRIRYLVQDQSGSAGARNRGIKESSAPLLAYLDSDNIWYPEFLQKAVDCLATEPDVDLVYGAMVIPQPEPEPPRIVWQPFFRETLLNHPLIDTNTMVHRRTLVEKYGGWSPEIQRIQDWDLVLRFTEEKPARRLPVFAVWYREDHENRITRNHNIGPSLLAIQKKWFPPKDLTTRPRVLYVIWHYPQLSESYIESEIRCMQRWGVHVEVWRTADGASTYPANVTIHDGDLSEAITACRPDVIHLHWLSFANSKIKSLQSFRIPITLRPYGFDVTPEGLAAYLAHDEVTAIYAFPNQMSGMADPRVKSTPAGFDSTLFLPSQYKDNRLVVRTSAGIPSKDLPLFFEAARQLPEFRFVLAVVTCYKKESYIQELLAIHQAMGSPVEIRLDLPREEIAKLMEEAGIYVHTLLTPGTPGATPVGQPISIAESMATGCLCFVRDIPDFLAYTGGCGASYKDLEDLAEKIRATMLWSDSEWRDVRRRASDHAFKNHADIVVYREMFTDWVNGISQDSAEEI